MCMNKILRQASFQQVLLGVFALAFSVFALAVSSGYVFAQSFGDTGDGFIYYGPQNTSGSCHNYPTNALAVVDSEGGTIWHHNVTVNPDGSVSAFDDNGKEMQVAPPGTAEPVGTPAPSGSFPEIPSGGDGVLLVDDAPSGSSPGSDPGTGSSTNEPAPFQPVTRTCSVIDSCTGARMNESFTLNSQSALNAFSCPAFFSNSQCEQCTNPPCRPLGGFSGDLTAEPLVRQDDPATLSWSRVNGNTCRIVSNRASWTHTLTTGQKPSGSRQSHSIQERTTFTLQCLHNGSYENVDSAIVNVVPIFQEI